nr:hypothetical protein [Streptomyces sp. DSM 41633]
MLWCRRCRLAKQVVAGVGIGKGAAAEIRASRLALLDTLTASFNRVLVGPIDPGLRARARRDQLAAARRAV